MKRIAIISLILMFAVVAYSKTCEECPPSKPCSATQPAGDGCNTFSFKTWCIDNTWYTDGMGTQTLVYCYKEYVIDNPFSGR